MRVGLTNFPVAERAKRHLIVELDRLGFPVIGKDAATGGDPVNGLCFDLLSSTDRSVVIGHDDGRHHDRPRRERPGLPGAPARRARRAVPHDARPLPPRGRATTTSGSSSTSPRDADRIARCRALFGDETADYQTAIDRHYAEGAAGRVGAVVPHELRDDASLRGLRRDVGALPAHLRHDRDGIRVRTDGGGGSRRVLALPRPRHRACGCRCRPRST